MVACAKVIAFFLAVVLLSLLVGQKHYKNRFFDDFEMLIFSFFGQKSRADNLAMVESITWPFFPKILPRKMAKLLTLLFHPFFTWFFQKSHSPCRKKKIFEKKKQKTTKTLNKKMAKLSAQHGQVISPTAYIYIYCHSVFASLHIFALLSPIMC